MNFFTSSEILISLLYSSVFGVIFGVFSMIISIAADCAESFLKIPSDIVKASSKLNKLPEIFKENLIITPAENAVKDFVKDFICVIFYGVSFSILLYITLDGKFRFYMLFFSLLAAYLFNMIIGRRLKKVLYCIFQILRSFSVVFFALVIFPFLVIFKKLSPVFIRFIKFCRNYFKNFKNSHDVRLKK